MRNSIGLGWLAAGAHAACGRRCLGADGDPVVARHDRRGRDAVLPLQLVEHVS